MKSLFILFLLFATHSINAQINTMTVQGGIEALKALSNNTAEVTYIADVERGGYFNRYYGNEKADNGMTLQDKAGRKWRRNTTDAVVNVKWFGAETSNKDNRPQFLAALEFIATHPRFTTLYIPGDASINSFYKLSDSILINFPVKILGDGTIGSPASRLQFARHKAGLVFLPTYPGNNFGVEVQNLFISGTTENDQKDISKHGIIFKTFMKMDNVWVDKMEGNGIHITACALQPAGNNNNYGSADGSILQNVTATFCLNGIFIEGCDASTIQVINSSTNENRRWGIFDNGFLGNSYLKPHAAFNGTQLFQGASSVVSFAGKYYVAKPGYDGYFEDVPDSNYNKPPEKNPAYWREVTKMESAAWNAKIRYYSGGAICIKNANANTNIINSYTEGFQPPIVLNPRSKLEGGQNAAGVVEGSFHNIYQNIEFIRNGGVVLPNSANAQHYLSVGNQTIDYSSPLKVYNDGGFTGNSVIAKFETNKATGYLTVKNSTSTGSIAYGAENFDFYTKDMVSYSARINTSGIFSMKNNTQDVGSFSSRWKTIFAAKGNFSEALSIGPYTVDESAILDLSSTTKGLLLPRMTKVQRNKINAPKEGLAIYQTDNIPGLRVYNGTNWIRYNETSD